MLSVLSLGLSMVHWSCTALPYSPIVEDNSGRPSGVVSSYCHELISVVSEFPQEPFPPSAHPTLYAAWGINSTTGSSGGAIHFFIYHGESIKAGDLKKKEAALDNVEGGMRESYSCT